MKPYLALLAATLPLLLGLAGCGKPPAKAEEIRPVRTIVVSAGATDAGNTYAGEVRPRYESDLGFRVSGKILARSVNVGDTVKNGQSLARLDAKDLALSEDSGRAQVAALDAQLAVAKSDYERNQKLFDEGVIDAHIERMRLLYRAVIDDGVRSGEFSGKGVEARGTCVFNAIMPFCHPQLVAEKFAEDRGEQAELMADFLLEALRSKKT